MGGTVIGAIRAGARRFGFLFAHYLPAVDREGPDTDRGAAGTFEVSALSGVRWRLVLGAGVVVGIVPYPLLYVVVYGYVLARALFDLGGQPEQFGRVMGLWGMPAMHGLLIALVVSWVARRAGTAAVAHGVLIALVSVVAGRVAGLYYGPAYLEEWVKYLLVALAGGLLGALEARNALSGQEALYKASRAISAARTPRVVVAAIDDYLAGPEAGGVALWQAPVRANDGPGSYEAPSWKPWFSRAWPAGVSLDGLDVPALARAGPVQLLRARDLPAHERAAWKSGGGRSVLLVPLVAPGDARVGLLAVASRRRRRLSRGPVRACLAVGAQAALVLENLRLLEEARHAGKQAGTLRERQRMAHEIHDTLAQGFTSIVMNLEAAEGVLSTESPGSGRARRHLDQARLTARESLTEARRLVRALRPEPLEESSLPQALDGLVRRWSDDSGVAAGVTVTGSPRLLSPEVEATLFRTAQEALTNVRKHADANRVALTLSYMGDRVTLDARDDGVGFDPSRAPAEARGRSSGGFGLEGMRERVEAAGGSLSVESAPGEGTTLAIELPAVAPDAVAPEAGMVDGAAPS